MNNQTLQSFTNPLYNKNNRNNKHKQNISLTEALTSNSKFNGLKESNSPHYKKTSLEIEYNTKPVSNFKKNNKLSEMLEKKNMKGLSGVPTKKISINELTNRKKSSIMAKHKKNVQNKEGLQNMLQNKMKYGESGYEKIHNKSNPTNVTKNRNYNQPNHVKETKIPDETFQSNPTKNKKEVSINSLNKWKYIISFCTCICVVMLILIIIFMILYFTTFNKSENIEESNNQQFILNKNLTNILSPITTFLTSTLPPMTTTSPPMTTTSPPMTTTSPPMTTTSPPMTTSSLPIVLNTLQYSQELKKYVENITSHILNVKEIVKVVLNTTHTLFLNLEEKYIQKIERIINEKYNKITPIFNKTLFKINNIVSSKINISEQTIKSKIQSETLKIHVTQQMIKSNIRKGNLNITTSLNNYFQNMLSFINSTVSSQKFIQYNLTNHLTNDYIHKIYVKDEIYIKYIIIFYVPFILYFIYECYKKYFYTKQKKTILPLNFPKSVQQNSGHEKNNKWKKKIKQLESNMNVIMELNKNEKNNKNK